MDKKPIQLPEEIKGYDAAELRAYLRTPAGYNLVAELRKDNTRFDVAYAFKVSPGTIASAESKAKEAATP